LDLINKSLLDSLDAQADAEPLSNSDSEHTTSASFGSASNSSSSGSSAAQFHMAMQSQQQIRIPRSDSPSDASNPSILQHIHSQDQLYNMHPNSNGIYPNGNQIHDYPTDLDIQKQQQSAKLNGAFPRAPFNSFPNTTRPRQMSSFRESTSSAFFPSQPSNDIFNPQLTSPTQSHMPPYLDSRQGYDFPNNLPKQSNYNNISAEPFNPSHKPPGQQHNTVFPPHGSQYGNGVSISSQTPFGPHNIVAGGMNGNVAPPQGLVNGSNQTSMHEDISTIFVVGFPDDMQVCYRFYKFRFQI
jgi:hypothetical protein